MAVFNCIHAELPRNITLEVRLRRSGYTSQRLYSVDFNRSFMRLSPDPMTANLFQLQPVQMSRE